MNCEKYKNFNDRKMRRPNQPLYVPPAFRSKFKNEFEDTMASTKGEYTREDANRQTCYFEKRESPQRRIIDIVPRRVRFESSYSSYDPKNASDESCIDNDSSDFEECSDGIISINSFKISKETIENNFNCHWKKGSSDSGSPAKNNQKENGETCTKISPQQLIQHKEYSDVKFSSNQGLKPKSNTKKPNRGLFFDYADSEVSSIETAIDNLVKTRSALTSTPTSDIIDEKVLDAAKYVPQEDNALQSILLFQNDSLTTNNTSGNDGNYNFEVYHDNESIEKNQKDFCEIFGNNYIPPPVPPPPHVSQLPPIHRLPISVSSSFEPSVPRTVFTQNMPLYVNQLRHPRILLPPSLQIHLNLPRGIHYRPSLSTQTRSVPFFPNPPCLPQGKIISPPSSRDMFTVPSLESLEKDRNFYIPPPVPPQPMRNIHNPNQCQDLQNYLLSTKTMMNKAMHDSKMFPRNLK